MKRIAVLTSGGDAPGMNACVRSVVRTALYHGLDVYGVRYGYSGLIEGDLFPMNSYSVSNILQRGGTILKSARCEEFRTKEGRKKAFLKMREKKIDGLVTIGGDGTFTGAKLMQEEHDIPVMGVPGTIDNDIYGTDTTIGFDTAVNTALEAIDNIRDTANSHDRVFFIEVMGRNTGYIALHCGIGGGAEMVMVPETSTTLDDVISTLEQGRDKQKTSAIVVVAEGDEQGNAHKVASEVKSRLPGLDIRVSTLGHMQRGGSPTSHDRILASRLGMHAVEGLINGKRKNMVGIIDSKIVFNTLSDGISKHKPLRDDLVQLVKIMNS